MLHQRHLALRQRLLLTLAGFAVILWSTQGESDPLIRRITTTTDEGISLNPSLSGDGHYIAFESTEDLSGDGESNSFHAIRGYISGSSPAVFAHMGNSRAVAPAVSQDGSQIAFASTADLSGKNSDGNSEIFLFDGSTLKQITDTTAVESRLKDGNFQPSITDDGRFLAFSSNRDLVGRNRDQNFEIFIYDTAFETLSQITDSQSIAGATDAKISGDGSRVAFIRNQGTAAAGKELVLFARSDNSETTIARDINALSLTYGRAISDDGLRVVYSAETGANQSQIFLFDGRSGTTRQITSLDARADDVPLQPTISGDGRRITFATRRRVQAGNTDRSVELYLYDIPSAQFMQLTDAPASANAEVVSSLDDSGVLCVFNFPRILSGAVASGDLANNSEIYAAAIPARAAFGTLTVLNGASLGNEPSNLKAIAPGSIVIARGTALAGRTEQSSRLSNGSFPLSLAGTVVRVNGRPTQILYVSPSQVNFIVPAETGVGQAEIVVTNSDGFPSKSAVPINSSAPGVFTTSGDGTGEGLILNAASFLPGPFDPTDNQLRLIIFATGINDAKNVSVLIGGRTASLETIISSAELPGLNEIHVLVPSDLRGAGLIDLMIEADNRPSNPVTVSLSGSSLRPIVINEVLVDPADGLAGDANGDGVRDSSQDEFVELVNTTTQDFDITGYELQSRSSNGPNDIVRHRFPTGTIIAAGTAIIIFGGGNADPHNPVFGSAQIFKASTGGLSLVNSGGVVSLRDTGGVLVTFLAYGGATGLRGDANQSLARSPDISGNFVLHQSASASSGTAFSPGTRLNGDPFLPNPAVAQILVSPIAANLKPGDKLQFTAAAFDRNSIVLEHVIFDWRSNNSSIVAVDKNGLATALAAGVVQLIALGRGVQSGPALITVVTPTPTPTPSPSPTVTPTPAPLIVISEFRTRGPGGANDEFVEIYNKSNASVDVSGWKLKGSSNAGSISTRLTINAGTLISAHGHLLAANSGAYSGAVTADQTYTSGIANDGGIAITLPDDRVVDQVGLSNGSAFKEGVPLAPFLTDVNQSYERKPGGLSGSTQDTNDNLTDFQVISPSDPQNLSSNPTPGPTPNPTPPPTPTPTPTPTPSPTPSPVPSPSPFSSPSPEVVISQIYGGGGNSGAVFRNDYIEIFNSGAAPVDLSGWSIQYASATTSAWSVTNLTSVSIAPGQYYLIQEASGGATGASLPTPDAIGTIAMSATTGKVALVNSTIALTGTCPGDDGLAPFNPNNAAVIDFVGYGSSSATANFCYEGAGPTAAPSNTNSIHRSSSGCIDSNNNSADFATATPNPRNTMSNVNHCDVAISIAPLSMGHPEHWRGLEELMFGHAIATTGCGWANFRWG